MRTRLSIGQATALRALATALLLAGSPPAFAQGYPAKEIRVVVPYSLGGGSDVTSRILAQRMSESLGRQLVIDNRAGANGRTRAVNRGPACGM